MSTYLEVVIQERSKDGRHILTHRHFKIDSQHPGTLATFLASRLNYELTAEKIPFDTSDPMRPCSLCWQIGQEANRDSR